MASALKRHCRLAWPWVLCLAGCASTVSYPPPPIRLPAHYAEADGTLASPDQELEADAQWWAVFQDALLSCLIEEGLQDSPDMAIAQARIGQARALEGIADGARYPTIALSATYQRRRGSEDVPIGAQPGGFGPGTRSNLWEAGFDASWEADLYGAQAAQRNGARANRAAAEDERSAAALSLAAEIARRYADLRALQLRLVLARQRSAQRDDLAGLMAARLHSGLAARQDALQAQAATAAAQSAIPPLEAEVQSLIYAIAFLVGRTPEELSPRLSEPGPIPAAGAEIPVGLPSDLLRRRPDILAAEHRLAAQAAQITQATADLYPHFSLTGILGHESLAFGTFPTHSSLYYSVGPGIRWLVFDADRVRFGIDAERARTDEYAARYQQTVQSALRDVETALVACARAGTRIQRLSEQVGLQQSARDATVRLYRSGLSDFTAVLQSEDALLGTEDEEASARHDSAVALVALFKAMGGGWRRPGDGH